MVEKQLWVIDLYPDGENFIMEFSDGHRAIIAPYVYAEVIEALRRFELQAKQSSDGSYKTVCVLLGRTAEYARPGSRLNCIEMMDLEYSQQQVATYLDEAGYSMSGWCAYAPILLDRLKTGTAELLS